MLNKKQTMELTFEQVLRWLSDNIEDLDEAELFDLHETIRIGEFE